MNLRTFKNNETYLPVTMQQFEDLTNEILTAINEVSAPHFIESDYAAQVLMSAIHAMNHEQGRVKKSELFESCINRISCHITYHVVQEIQAKIKAKTPPGDVQTAPSEPESGDATMIPPHPVSLVPDAKESG